MHAAVRNESLSATIASLTSSGLLDMQGTEKAYLGNEVVQSWLRAVVEDGAATLKNGAPGSFLAILSHYNCRLGVQIPESLYRHAIPLLQSRFDNIEFPLPAEADPVFRWWGKNGAIALPTYDGSRIIGFWLITVKGNNYLPIVTSKTGAALGRIPSLGDDAVFVIDNAIEALRLTVWSSVHCSRPYGFVVPVGLQDALEHYAAKRVIYWSMTDDTRWIMRSRHCAHNLVLLNSSVGRGSGPFPCNGDFPHFMDIVKNSAVSTYHGIAKHLLTIPRRQAGEAIATEPIEPTDRARIIAQATGEDARFLQQLFSSQSQTVVDWCGTPVTETTRGWVTKGKLISAVMFYMDEVRPHDTGTDATVTGSVVYDGKSVAFQEKLSTLRKNTAQWLESFVVKKFGAICFIERAWRPRLLELSQRFRKPNAVMPEQRYGWSGKTLRMPFFIVDDKDVTPSYEIVDGPRIPLPSPLSAAERDAFQSESFCKIFLMLLRNMLKARDGASHGWLLVNQPTLIDRVAYALGMDIQFNPSDAVLLMQRTEPVIRPTSLTDSVTRVLAQRPTHALISVDTATAKIAHIFHSWPIMSVTSAVEYQPLRGVFFAVHHSLSQPRTIRNHRDCAVLVSECFDVKGALNYAGLELDREVLESEQSTATKLMRFLVEQHLAGELEAVPTADGIRVRTSDVVTCVTGTQVEVPPLKDITRQLASGEFLVGNTESEWELKTAMWSFYTSLVMAAR
jgi:hypothetical protein